MSCSISSEFELPFSKPVALTRRRPTGPTIVPFPRSFRSSPLPHSVIETPLAVPIPFVETRSQSEAGKRPPVSQLRPAARLPSTISTNAEERKAKEEKLEERREERRRWWRRRKRRRLQRKQDARVARSQSVVVLPACLPARLLPPACLPCPLSPTLALWSWIL